jgi:hypothetical protein
MKEIYSNVLVVHAVIFENDQDIITVKLIDWMLVLSVATNLEI